MAKQKKTRKAASPAAGDLITVDNRGNSSAMAAGRGARAVVSPHAGPLEMDAWLDQMEKRIDALRDLLPADKADLKGTASRVAEEISKGKEADAGRLERLLNTIGSMAPDIFDVAVATLANPLAGLGLVAKKIGEKVKVERQGVS